MKTMKSRVFFASASILSTGVLLLSFQNCSKNNSALNSSTSPSISNPGSTPGGGSSELPSMISKTSASSFTGPSGTDWNYKLNYNGSKLEFSVIYKNDALSEKTGAYTFDASGLSKTEFSCLNKKSVAGGTTGNLYETHFLICWDPIKERALGYHRVFNISAGTWSAVVAHPVVTTDGLGEMPRIVRSNTSDGSFWVHEVFSDEDGLTALSIDWNPSYAVPIRAYATRGLALNKTGQVLAKPALSSTQNNALEVSYSSAGQVSFVHRLTNPPPGTQQKVYQHYDFENTTSAVFNFTLKPQYSCAINMYVNGQPAADGARFDFNPGQNQKLSANFVFSGPLPPGLKVNYFHMFFYKDQNEIEIGRDGKMEYGPMTSTLSQKGFSLPDFTVSQYGYYNISAQLIKFDRNGKQVVLCQSTNLVVAKPAF